MRQTFPDPIIAFTRERDRWIVTMRHRYQWYSEHDKSLRGALKKLSQTLHILNPREVGPQSLELMQMALGEVMEELR